MLCSVSGASGKFKIKIDLFKQNTAQCMLYLKRLYIKKILRTFNSDTKKSGYRIIYIYIQFCYAFHLVIKIKGRRNTLT